MHICFTRSDLNVLTLQRITYDENNIRIVSPPPPPKPQQNEQYLQTKYFVLKGLIFLYLIHSNSYQCMCTLCFSWISLSIGLTTTLTQVKAWCQTHENHYLHHVWLFTAACLANNCTTIRTHALPCLHVLLNQLPSALLYSFWFSPALSISCSDIRYVSFVELLHNIQSKIWSTYLIRLAHADHAALRRMKWIFCRVDRFVDIGGL